MAGTQSEPVDCNIYIAVSLPPYLGLVWLVTYYLCQKRATGLMPANAWTGLGTDLGAVVLQVLTRWLPGNHALAHIYSALG